MDITQYHGGHNLQRIFREWLWQVVSAKPVKDGIMSANIWKLTACFYANIELVLSRDPEVLHQAFHLISELFDCVGLWTNTKKTEVVTFPPG